MEKQLLQACHLFLIMYLAAELANHFALLLPVVHRLLTSLCAEINVVGVLVIVVDSFTVFVSPKIVVEK